MLVFLKKIKRVDIHFSSEKGSYIYTYPIKSTRFGSDSGEYLGLAGKSQMGLSF